MLMYALIGLSLVLVGVAGLQFSYLFYVNRLYHERRRHIYSLERRCAELTARVEAAEARLQEQDKLIAEIDPDFISMGDAWADVIEDR